MRAVKGTSSRLHLDRHVLAGERDAGQADRARKANGRTGDQAGQCNRAASSGMLDGAVEIDQPGRHAPVATMAIRHLLAAGHVTGPTVTRSAGRSLLPVPDSVATTMRRAEDDLHAVSSIEIRREMSEVLVAQHHHVQVGQADREAPDGRRGRIEGQAARQDQEGLCDQVVPVIETIAALGSVGVILERRAAGDDQ